MQVIPMRRGYLFLLVGALLSLNAHAQLLQVTMTTDRKNFLPNQAVVVKLAVTNVSSLNVILADGEDWIQFSAHDGRGIPVLRNGNPPRGKSVLVENGKRHVWTFQLAPIFDFSKPGVFTIHARIKIRQFNNFTLDVRPLKFQVVAGVKIAEMRRGVAPRQIGQPPDLRTYTLRSTRVHGRTHLFLRVEGTRGNEMQIYNVLDLGRKVPFGKPQMEMDPKGVTHVFFQFYAKNFRYYQVDPQGQLLVRQTYYFRQYPPVLVRDDDGRVGITGAHRELMKDDFPKVPDRKRTSIGRPVPPDLLLKK
jgi:hypothetical protein